MTTMTTALKSPDQVKAELQERLPHLVSIATITVEQASPEHEPWVWLKLPSKPSEADRNVLKHSDGSGIGFRWSKSRTSWFHTCRMDPSKIRGGGRRYPKRRTGKATAGKTSSPKEEERAVAKSATTARPRAGRLPSVSADAFRKLCN